MDTNKSVETTNEVGVKAQTKVEVSAPTGAGKFNDMVTVKGSNKHPTMPNQEYRVHAAHVPYLTAKGFIEGKAKKVEA